MKLEKNFSNIGVRLRVERERLGMSQDEFGEIAGITRRTVTAWERGDQFPNAAFLAIAASKGMDVSFVLTGQRNPAPHTPTVEQQEKLANRGIRWGAGERQAEVEISPLGLLWMLNLHCSLDTGEPLRWDAVLMERLAQLKPVHMLGLNLQVVRLHPYGDKDYLQLIMYLDKTPPSTPWSLSPSAGLKSRYELDVEAYSLPLVLPDDGYLPPVLRLPEGDLVTLSQGNPVRYVTSAIDESAA